MSNLFSVLPWVFILGFAYYRICGPARLTTERQGQRFKYTIIVSLRNQQEKRVIVYSYGFYASITHLNWDTKKIEALIGVPKENVESIKLENELIDLDGERGFLPWSFHQT